MKTTEKELQDEIHHLLTCSEEEFQELTKDFKEEIDRISKKMPSPTELLEMANARKKS